MLRPYQQAAVDAVYRHLRGREDNPCVVLPTASGKSHVIAQICADTVQRWQGRVIVLAHVRELVEQNADKFRNAHPDLPIGIYSAGLNSRDVGYAVTIAGIQSVYQKAELLGSADLILIDESHLIPPDGEGMYRTFLAAAKRINPQVRVIGFTATPFRMSTGPICTPDGILNEICYEIGVRELIAQGYLCPLQSKAGTQKANLSGVHIRGGEFVANELEAAMEGYGLVTSACREIAGYCQDRKSVLVFTSGVRHGQHVTAELEKISRQRVGFITGETPGLERESQIAEFKSGVLKYLVNVNVLTTGFDAPNIDCVALLRPTLSPGLMYQMIGRAFRLHPGKQDALILDFGGNILRHGPVDCLRIEEPGNRGKGEAPAKECPACYELIAAGYARCPACGYEFPARQAAQHEAEAGGESVLSKTQRETHPVRHVFYSVHQKKDASPDHPRTLRVDYQIGNLRIITEWVCLEHDGYAFAKALAWWRARTDQPVPDTIEEAVTLAEGGGLAQPKTITVETKAGERFPRVISAELGPIPSPPASPPAQSVAPGAILDAESSQSTQYGLTSPLSRPDGLPEEVPF